jgi:hypothetical protein
MKKTPKVQRPTPNVEFQKDLETTMMRGTPGFCFLFSTLGVRRWALDVFFIFSWEWIERPSRRITMSCSGPNGKKQCLE